MSGSLLQSDRRGVRTENRLVDSLDLVGDSQERWVVGDSGIQMRIVVVRA